MPNVPPGFMLDPSLVEPKADLIQHVPWMMLGQGAIVWGIFCETRLRGVCTPAQTGKTIGMFIRGLLLVQAMLIASAGIFGAAIAGVVLLGWPVNRLLSKAFPPS
jgi:hypothetical protein